MSNKLQSIQIDHEGNNLKDLIDNLENAASNNVYVHPATHPVSMIEGALSAMEISQLVLGVIDDAPANLNTIAKVAAAINNDPDFTNTINNSINARAIRHSGNGVFSGTTLTINSADCTENDIVTIYPQEIILGDKTGNWSVVSANGSFTIESDISETTAVPFIWEYISGGIVE